MWQKIGASCWRYKHFWEKVIVGKKDTKITTFRYSGWVFGSYEIDTSYSYIWIIWTYCFCNNSWICWILHYNLSLNIFWIWYYLWSPSRPPTVPVIRLSKIFSTVHYTFSSHKYIATIKIWWIGLWVYNENTKRCELD